jgi:hypothetical protein
VNAHVLRSETQTKNRATAKSLPICIETVCRDKLFSSLVPIAHTNSNLVTLIQTSVKKVLAEHVTHVLDSNSSAGYHLENWKKVAHSTLQEQD